MKQTLQENGGLPASILWTLAIVAGISVANLYYNQPLLNMIRQDLNVSEFHTNSCHDNPDRVRDRITLYRSIGRLVSTEKDHHYQLFPTDPLPFNHSHGPLDQRNSRSLTSDRYLFHGPANLYPDSLTILPTRTQGA